MALLRVAPATMVVDYEPVGVSKGATVSPGGSERWRGWGDMSGPPVPARTDILGWYRRRQASVVTSAAGRVGERRQLVKRVVAERRRGDRRQRDLAKDLQTFGWALVRR